MNNIVLERILKEYYKENSSKVYEPPNLNEREFGFTFFDDSFKRHMGFNSHSEYIDFLIRATPKDVYYSVAMYHDPKLPMNEKGWIGAELAFDLDADQLLKTDDQLIKSGWISPRVYQVIKERFVLLLEGFIEDDFGITKNEYVIVFSGGRGYHLRICIEPYIGLDQKIRRQIVEYVSLGLKPSFSVKTNVIQPFTHDYGWNRRLYSLIREIDQARLTDLGLSNDLVTRRVISAFRRAKKPTDVRLSKAETGSIRNLFNAVLDYSTVAIDERVTVDINRLLRAPGTVHGGSGLLCKILTKADLENFDPFRDASMKMTGRSRVFVKRVPFEVNINDESVSPDLNGRTIELNKPLAYYIVVRNGGDFVDETI
jgi:DNA primase small subunit